MKRIYEYRGYSVDVTVEAGFHGFTGRPVAARGGYVVAVTLTTTADAAPPLPPLRLGEAGGHPFTTEVDALMGGYSAGRRAIDEALAPALALEGHPGHR